MQAPDGTYIKELQWNRLIGAIPSSYTVFEISGTYYGECNIPGGSDLTPSTTAATVVQAAIDALTEGVVFLKNMDIPAGVTEKDGVVVISYDDGTHSFRYTNPTTETGAVTNTENVLIHNILCQPTNDPPTKSAWCAFTTEIIGKTGLTKDIAAGYFGAYAPSGSAQNIWGLNPLVYLDLGSTGNALGIEIDVNNLQAHGKGQGMTITGLGDFNPYLGIMIERADSTEWQRGIWIANTDQLHVIMQPADDDDASNKTLALLNAAGDTWLAWLTKSGQFNGSTDGIVTKTKAGTLSDADFTVDTTGLIGIDTTNDRIYFRTAAAEWHYCTATAGFEIPKEEKNCPICGDAIQKGDVVCGRINSEKEDGALHGLYVHLKCALKEN